MSYILKALRKSEAERAKGSVPKLTHYHGPEPTRQTSVLPWVVIAALVVNAVIGGFMLWRTDVLPWLRGEDAAPVQQVAAAPAPSDQGLAAKPAARAGEPVEAAAAAAPREEAPEAPAPAVRTTLPSAEPARRDAAGSDGRTAQSTAQAQEPPSPDRVSEAAAARIGDALEPAPRAARVAAEPDVRPRPATRIRREAFDPPEPPRKPESLRARLSDPANKYIEDLDAYAEELFASTDADGQPLPDQDPETTDLAALVPRTATRDEPPAVAEPDPYAEVPMLWQMPRAFRTRVPQMSISVHVYAPEAPGRFVIIDRKKYWEGDVLAEDLMLEAIVADGVVLQYDGQPFKLSSQ